MAYDYVINAEAKAVKKQCEELIHKVQDELYDYFTFDIRLIGSGETRLIMRQGESGAFDFDYNLILQKDKKKLISSDVKKIKELFITAFNNAVKGSVLKNAQNRHSVITIKLIDGNSVKFSFDVAIVYEGNNGNFYKLAFDKQNNRYLWNELKNTKNYQQRFKAVKDAGKWAEFREKYKEKKNDSAKRNHPSFSIFLETLNEIMPEGKKR